MQEGTIHILSTRPLDGELVRHAAGQRIVIDTIALIHTETVMNDELRKEVTALSSVPATVVFTSMNAVKAVAALIDNNHPQWNIYCLGEATVELVRKQFHLSCVITTAASGSELADKIIEEGHINEAVFFCGDQRRPELPQKLREHKIAVNEVIVYRTKLTPAKISRQYNGILFFSPSAVESFFSANTVNAQTILFAIGKTTGNTIKKFSSNEVITAEKPGKNVLAQKAIDHFTTQRSCN
ncbi:MAG TPA: uroporphyrinogen-III synthase [Chitinophagaceae bacterium]|nr:uroporphyrinogen-III synthase [Chitinophagaceae bacterium]